MQGQVIAGKYRLDRVLGKGGMGSVWLAEHLSLHAQVAVKLIHFEAAKNPNARARFDREAQVVAKIRSAHVVKVLDHGVTDEGLPYIVMECLTGECLRDRLKARHRLTAAETAKVVSHVCRALARAHEVGLVHRDLKPENLFVASEEDGEIVKILDFGVAKATDVLAVSGMDPTRTGTLLGTPYYMSPEQAQGLRSVDFRSDLWAVGVLAFECLTGKRPFTAPALGPLIAKIVHTAPPTLAEIAPDAQIPADLEAWMRKALAREPAARFASAKELSDAFMVAAGAADTLEPSLGGAGSLAGTLPPATMGGAHTVPTPSESVAPGGTIVMDSVGEADALDSAATVLLPTTHGGTPGSGAPPPEAPPAAAPPSATPASPPEASPVDLATSSLTMAPATRAPARGLVLAVVVLAVVVVLMGGALTVVLLR